MRRRGVRVGGPVEPSSLREKGTWKHRDPGPRWQDMGARPGQRGSADQGKGSGAIGENRRRGRWDGGPGRARAGPSGQQPYQQPYPTAYQQPQPYQYQQPYAQYQPANGQPYAQPGQQSYGTQAETDYRAPGWES